MADLLFASSALGDVLEGHQPAPLRRGLEGNRQRASAGDIPDRRTMLREAFHRDEVFADPADIGDVDIKVAP